MPAPYNSINTDKDPSSGLFSEIVLVHAAADTQARTAITVASIQTGRLHFDVPSANLMSQQVTGALDGILRSRALDLIETVSNLIYNPGQPVFPPADIYTFESVVSTYTWEPGTLDRPAQAKCQIATRSNSPDLHPSANIVRANTSRNARHGNSNRLRPSSTPHAPGLSRRSFAAAAPTRVQASGRNVLPSDSSDDTTDARNSAPRQAARQPAGHRNLALQTLRPSRLPRPVAPSAAAATSSTRAQYNLTSSTEHPSYAPQLVAVTPITVLSARCALVPSAPQRSHLPQPASATGTADSSSRRPTRRNSTLNLLINTINSDQDPSSNLFSESTPDHSVRASSLPAFAPIAVTEDATEVVDQNPSLPPPAGLFETFHTCDTTNAAHARERRRPKTANSRNRPRSESTAPTSRWRASAMGTP